MSDWEPPKEFPNLTVAKEIAIDLETRDPNLGTMGPGGVRGDGYIIGFSIAAEGYQGYFPIRHDGGGNLDPDHTLSWLRDALSTDIPKIGANILYDLEWLRAEDVDVRGDKIDVQIAEPLLDENKLRYSLDALAQAHLGETKDESALLAYAQSQGYTKANYKSEMWRFHSKHVGPYGEKDANLPLRIWAKQKQRLQEDDLMEVFRLETRIVDLLLEMRFKGVPVDLDLAERTRAQMAKEQAEHLRRIEKLSGTGVDIWSGKSIQVAADRLGLYYPTTEKGNPSFEADWLETQTDSEFYFSLAKARKLDRGGAVFIESKILNLAHNGRVHPRFRQVRGDKGDDKDSGVKGTRSGRFSSEDPNMQQVPARDPAIAIPVRSCFIPEPGCEWMVGDYSQQEPRVTVHYASICEFPGAEEAVRRYIENPDTDYHQLTKEMIYEYSGLEIDRSNVAKPMNLGLAYGMGKNKMAGQLGLSMRDTNRIYAAYHKAMPYVKLLGEEAALVASERGFIKTILGRRRRFDLFGPPGWKKGLVPKKYDEAVEEWGDNVVRYFTHKAMNALVQGSSGDMMKKAMVDCFDAGFVPHITIHDELDLSVETHEQARQIRDIMVNAIKLRVPLKVDVELGPSWGQAKKVQI